jgi:hypothetical protein
VSNGFVRTFSYEFRSHASFDASVHQNSFERSAF